MTGRTIHLHIERLVLEDFAPGTTGSGARVADGVERELRRLVAGAVPPDWGRAGALEGVRAPAFQLSSAGTPERLGERVAASIYASIARKERP